ncbi:hypothetical protein CQ12_16025 [Bradyrhizobium jicamae]|uniref:HTH gntR-type domain-containing protein n=1 Tax=Bradyrhizobium jicamae TaxID=280332 RepID=A0A0R3MB46_9BRAD|nr:FCD domain-containing protein [Bradyrhizobium jicamae]KRR15295.1 hypothetical protein CQ12_16025 [Bradyrhizobium jicamae]
MQLSESSTKSLATQAAEVLRAKILSGLEVPGARLGIDDLKQRLGVGASPLREALNLLVAEGLVQRIDQRGFRVARADRSELADLIKTRCMIEGAALRASIAQGDLAWEEGVVATLHRIGRIPRSLSSERFDPNPAWDEAHQVFHLALISACGATMLLDICKTLHQRATRFRNLSNSVGWGERDVASEHAALAEAAIQRRADDAVRLLEAHYRRTGLVLEQGIEAVATSRL